MEPTMDAIHKAYATCTRALQKLPPEDQKRVVQSLAVLFQIIPYDQGAK
jgi:hypothetical protein